MQISTTRRNLADQPSSRFPKNSRTEPSDFHPTGKPDELALSDEIEELRKKAEGMHGRGEALALTAFFGLPAYTFGSCVLASSFFPDIRGVAPYFMVGSAFAGLTAGSIWASSKGDQVRLEAETLNQSLPNSKPLDWSWSMSKKW